MLYQETVMLDFLELIIEIADCDSWKTFVAILVMVGILALFYFLVL